MTRWSGLVGMNRRNLVVSATNSTRSVRLVGDKVATKVALARAGVPTVPTLATVTDRLDLRLFDERGLPDEWVCKPARGAAGRGVLVVGGRTPGGWLDASGREMTREYVTAHFLSVLSGEHSASSADVALVEPRLRPAPELADLGATGLPDLRVLCIEGRTRLVMLRLPTRRSGGRANLHQGGLGLSVDPDDGRIVRAVLDGREVTRHPDTGAMVIGASIPRIDEVVSVAEAASTVTGLGLSGVDVIVDEDHRTSVLEVNARPGLQIQQVCDRTLAA